MAEQRLEWMLGVVAQSNSRGIKLQGEDDFHNWSQYGAPAESQRPVPSRGTTVKLGLDNKGFIRDIKDRDGNPMTAGGGGGGGGGGMTIVDIRRMTLLSTLKSSVELLAVAGLPEPAEGQARPKPSTIAMQIAKAWADAVMKWAEQGQQRPEPAKEAATDQE